MVTAPAHHRFVRYRQWMLVVFVIALACLASFLGIKVKEAREFKQAISAVLRAGGEVIYEYQKKGQFLKPPGPAWLRERIGDEYFLRAHSVEFYDSNVTNESLTTIGRLSTLELLYLPAPNISDAGLLHLKGLTKLKYLYLSDTKITDAGLEYLKGLTNLKRLELFRTRVTDQGVEKLQQALPNCKIAR